MVFCFGVASVAPRDELVESGREFGAALCIDGLFELVQRSVRMGLDHVCNRKPVVGRKLFGSVFKPFLDLVDFITRQVPVLRLSGEPLLRMAQLRRRHELTQARRMRLRRRLRSEDKTDFPIPRACLFA